MTLTIPHGERDSLGETFDLLADAWRVGVLGGRGFRDDRIAWGVPAWVRTVEVTLGANGWHPHIHLLLFTRKPWTGRQRALRGAALFRRWSRYVERITGAVCSSAAFKIVPGAKGAGDYVAKLQDGDASALGMEFTRGDLKTGRVKSLTPFELLPAAHAGEAWALRRWWEWESTTLGRRCMTWSRGARTYLGLNEREATDAELAEAEVGGEVVATIPGDVWARVASVAFLETQLLQAAEAGPVSLAHALNGLPPP